MEPRDIGHAGLQGWRKVVADKSAATVSEHTPLDEDQWRALVGATFLVLSVLYVINAVKAIVDEA
jgi:hypothetical protein